MSNTLYVVLGPNLQSNLDTLGYMSCITILHGLVNEAYICDLMF
jgi:hypothetical protein